MSNRFNVSKIEFMDGGQEYCIRESGCWGGAKTGSDKLEKETKLGIREKMSLTPFGWGKEVKEFRPRTEEDKLRSEKESIRRALKEVEIIGRANKWDWFLTLTFKDDACGFDWKSAHDAFMKWLDRMRKRYSNMEYLIVLEQGKKNGRWHAHALVFGADFDMVYSGRKTKDTHMPIYNLSLADYDMGFTTATRVRSSAKCGMYISKYIGKSLGDIPSGSKRYWSSRGVNRLDDVREKYLFDSQEELSAVVETLVGMADRVTRVFVEALNTWFIYIKIFAPVTDLAVAPT